MKAILNNKYIAVQYGIKYLHEIIFVGVWSFQTTQIPLLS